MCLRPLFGVQRRQRRITLRAVCFGRAETLMVASTYSAISPLVRVRKPIPVQMPSRRYTILVADRSSGVVRRATVSLRPAMIVIAAVFSVPVLIGLGAAWKAKSDTVDLRSNHGALEIENASYRAATDALAGQIQSLQAAISDIGTKSTLDPTVARAIEKLPAVVKSRAMGGGSTELQRSAQSAVSSITSPEDTFGLLRML